VSNLQKAFKLKLLFPAWQYGAWFALASFVSGGAGFLAVASCLILSRLGGVDNPAQHGISVQSASRMGGAVIVVFLMLNLAQQKLSGGLSLPQTYPFGLLTVLSFYLLGLIEDFVGGIAPRLRLLVMLTLAAIFAATSLNLFLGSDKTAPLVRWLGNWHSLTLPVAILWIAGLPNAFNIADGANGLVAGLSSVIFIALIDTGVQLGLTVAVWEILLVGTLLFLLPNVLTGKLFLGDGGAYLLGSALAVSIIVVLSVAPHLTTYYLVLMFYPLADLGCAILRRVMNGRSPLSADERHLHNYIYSRLRRRTEPLLANSVTGLSIVALFTGVPFLLGQWLIISPWNWLWVLALQLLSYLLLWQWLNKTDAK